MSRRPFERPISHTTWYMRHSRYRAYMLREVTCILVAVYCVLVLLALLALSSGQPERWDAFVAGQQNVFWLVFHAFSLVFFTIYQTIAWFRLAPKAMPLQLGDKVVPPSAIVAAHYAAWIVATIIVFVLAGVF
jgi:fumarate reductase subunit C